MCRFLGLGREGLATRKPQSKHTEECFSILFSEHFSIFHLKRVILSKNRYDTTWRNYSWSLKYETNILILFEVPLAVKTQTKNHWNTSITRVETW